MTGTDLTIRADQTEWTPAQVAALQQLGVADASPADLAVFLHQAQRTGLDPFARQLYMIGRYDRRSGRTKQTIQTGIDGLRLVAARRAERMGVPLSISAAEYADPRTGDFRPVLPAGVAPLAARVTVRLGDGTYEATAYLSEYAQTGRDGSPTGMWARMPMTMLGKCAEAQALRKACPMDLSGIYTAEEMQQADQAAAAEQPQPQPAQGAPSGRERLIAEWLTVHRYDSSDATVQRLAAEAEAAGVDATPDAYRAWLDSQLAASTADSDTVDAVDAEVVDDDGVDVEDTTTDAMDGAEIIGEETVA
ncbi:phage recombination protein Bet [Actinomyces sp. 432]|uniref:phage recombination protein Bet n=1 Tax=Actinomyces sp. 432 TaxID=2057798 RepID=UPI0013746A12|nr:phage recombination protein Bet [Actinomyces sp. 432]QHO91956.1 phage recombination protein Bet [Actinomyces sp. 432]